MPAFAVWDLPDPVIFSILQFVAQPTERASFFCRVWGVLCKDAYSSLRDPVFEMILYHDYGVASELPSSSRRASKRLRLSAKQRVQSSHRLMKSNTEIAFYYLAELTSKKNGLTKAKLQGVIEEYGPRLRFNNLVSSGSTFLVQVCRAVADERKILACVQTLVEHYGSEVNLRTDESPSCQQTPLGVAAARGFRQLVEYLVSRNASLVKGSTGRMTLTRRPGGGHGTRSVRCDNVIPIKWADAMLEAERKQRTREADLAGLKGCVDFLRRAMSTPVR